MAREMQCDICDAAKRPPPALPANPPDVTGFNDRVGLDVIEIPNWLPDTPYRKAVNIVDHGSALQKVHTIDGIENAAN
eukprot:13294278-Alexandrium_andersonii.AAC.1